MNDLWVFKPNIVLLASGLLRFTVTTNRNEALLNWQTAGEDNGYFNIQRSTDGMHWQTPGTVMTAAQNSGAGNYGFNDRHPAAGANYYRLQQQDASGQIAYSKIEAANFFPLSRLTWQPAGEGTVKLRLQNGQRESYLLTAMDGKTCRRGNLRNGEAVINGLTAGLYVLQVITGAGPVTEKIMIW